MILASIVWKFKNFWTLESEDFRTLNSIKKLGIRIIKRKNFYEVFGNGGVFLDPSEKLDLEIQELE